MQLLLFIPGLAAVVFGSMYSTHPRLFSKDKKHLHHGDSIRFHISILTIFAGMWAVVISLF